MSIEMTPDEILSDLRVRMHRAVETLRANAASYEDNPDEALRLTAKANGVALAISYLGDYTIAPPGYRGECAARL